MQIITTGSDAAGHGIRESGRILPEYLVHSRIIGAVTAVNGTVVAANDFFLEIAGRSREELDGGLVQWPALSDAQPGAPFQTDLFRPDGLVATVVVEVIRRHVSGCTAMVVDVTAARAAEQTLTRAREVLEERSRELFGVAEKLTEQEEALAAVSRDQLTTAAALEAERQRVEELALGLANANRELDAFSYSVSHDLRAPLRSIDGFSRVLLSGYAAMLDDRGRDYLQRIRAATQRMSHLLDDLLRLARTSRAVLSPATVNLSAGAEAVAAELQQSEPARRVTWKIEPGLVVRGDRTLLRVLLDNLLGNAWKFTSRREHSVIELGRDDDGLFIRDNGAGFDMKYADQLFGLFQRLHTADEFEGTGIGLATVQRIVHKHGGRIWAEAAVGEGATFHFTLGNPL
ncbi:MAG TPA: ATP-binding protein [Thermoanaerobaculia bacterium]|nr:ATP-binding protein [Thermoanaerobaculia bacterium]